MIADIFVYHSILFQSTPELIHRVTRRRIEAGRLLLPVNEEAIKIITMRIPHCQ